MYCLHHWGEDNWRATTLAITSSFPRHYLASLYGMANEQLFQANKPFGSYHPKHSEDGLNMVSETLKQTGVKRYKVPEDV
jgi:hypothetical protein